MSVMVTYMTDTDYYVTFTLALSSYQVNHPASGPAASDQKLYPTTLVSSIYMQYQSNLYAIYTGASSAIAGSD